MIFFCDNWRLEFYSESNNKSNLGSLQILVGKLNKTKTKKKD
ncbi:hypothetical protein [uncultured Methanobrevibacter sp.]|nr:hypothetical protein [uncultured Methanobrevibacter sp.]